MNARPTVTAGLANDVDEVNQYAAPIHAPTAAGAAPLRPERASANTSTTSPPVATTSASHRCPALRTVRENATAGSANMALARTAPPIAPATWAST